ncbi:MAG: hypothetical protein Q8P18_15190 [Pseudomonadota bacterium]|nr:hypothetical protein [Pseudomonadota bacterium]
MLSMLLVLVGLANAQAGPFRSAQPGPFGAGVILGPTTGVSLAWRPNGWNAVQSAIGWDLGAERVDLSADYLQSLRVLEPTGGTRMPLYIGLGAGVVSAAPGMFGENAGVSARVPVGASLFFERLPIELFAQVVPRVQVIPSTGFGVDAGIGGRFYF